MIVGGQAKITCLGIEGQEEYERKGFGCNTALGQTAYCRI
jgi:hypothetical protein